MATNRYSLRCILVATDLGRASDAVVISAADNPNGTKAQPLGKLDVDLK